MSSIRGTNVLAPVVPFDTTDAHASHEARYGKGGYRSVADIAERDAIPQLRRESGMLVCVLTDGKVWKLGDNLTTWTEFAVSSDWATLSGKPSTFTPSIHTHTASAITDFSSAVAAAAPPTTDASLLTSGTLSTSRLPASAVLTTDGRLSDARTPTAHSHAVADVTGLQTALDAKQAAGSYAAASHTHTAGQVSGLAAVATSGSYSDLSNKPTIPAAVTSLPAASITGLATVATSGSYTDLTNKPTIPAAVTSLPAASITGLAAVATSGSYADLSSKPSIPSAYSLPVATSTVLGGVKQGSNVTIGADGTVSVAAPVTTLAAGAITGLATVATSGAYADLSGKPTLFSGSYADLTSVPASFVPSAHNQAWSTITSTPTTLSGYGITDAVGSSDSRLSDARTPTTHTHPLSSLTQSSATTGQVVTWSGSAWSPAATASSVVSYATTAAFPATGLAGLLYLSSDTSKLYRWESTLYVEVGAIATSVSASDISVGTLDAARLPASAVLTSDSRLSDSRSPTSHASSHASGGADAITPSSIGAASSSHTHSSAAITDFATEAAKYGPVVSVAGRTGTVTIASSDVSGLPTAGTASTNYCAGNDSRLSDSRVPTSHVHGNVTNAGSIGSTSGQIVVTTTSGVLTTAATIAAASQVSGLAAVATSGSAADLSGTLADARLSSTVTTALTNARTPTSHASSHATGGSDAITATNIGAAATSHVHAATEITSGILPDARLSSAVATHAALALAANQNASALDIFPRGECNQANAGPVSGSTWWMFFTPATTLTVSSITIVTGTTTAASGITLARMGIYTFDETTATLVARTASDTTLFAATSTAFQRSFATAGGFPSSYTLTAGTRYGVGLVIVGTTMPTLVCRTVGVAVGAVSPKMAGNLASQSDLPTSATVTAIQQSHVWARLS